MRSRTTVALALALGLTLAAPAPVLAQDAEQHYRDARGALTRQAYEEAIAGFEALRREYPDSRYTGDSYYWQAFALERTGELARAVEVIDALLREDPRAAARNDAEAMRLRLCSELARLGDRECAETIAASVRDPDRLDDATRMAAVNALINMRASSAVPIAARVAADRDQPAAIRRQALFVLGNKGADAEMQSEARETLRRIALDDSDRREVRDQAVFWLSKVPGEETLDVLSQLVTSGGDIELRKRAIFGLSQHGTEEASGLLRRLAEDQTLDRALRSQAIFWIGNRGSAQALPYLAELYPRLPEEELRKQVLFAVSQIGTADAAQWLAGRAEDGAESIEQRKQALFWASQLGLTAEQLTALYHRFDEPALRQHLIWLIAQRGGDGSAETLFEIARNDPDPAMRRSAVFWLGSSNDPRAAEFLIQLLEL